MSAAWPGATPSSRRAAGFYELRIYKAQPGKRDALAARFASRTASIYARYGITNVGYLIPQESDKELGIDAEDTFIYIRGYPSKEERDKRLKAARDDPEFAEVVIDAGTQPRHPADREGAQHRHDPERPADGDHAHAIGRTGTGRVNLVLFDGQKSAR